MLAMLVKYFSPIECDKAVVREILLGLIIDIHSTQEDLWLLSADPQEFSPEFEHLIEKSVHTGLKDGDYSVCS